MFVRPSLPFLPRRDMQIFDLMELAGKEWDMKSACRKDIRAFDEWKNAGESAQRLSSAIYLAASGYFLRRRARKSVQFYRIVRRRRIRLFRDYLQALPLRGFCMTAIA
ncbi:MAG: hypothetical protein DI626_07890 [Micavibrio aeruginosavorus]|uniref:Uncharacterized protein n=1 Tax=Micavibrio aeruginosavorus TaxID=349221 RepID=A0A2W4ZRC4_9BACT|nr:MAG: hypothetical protein DI626_07890 [Micavibrio aeruginosavorus]